MLKYLTSIAATVIVLLILLATSVPLLHWFEAQGRIEENEEQRNLWRSQRLYDYTFTLEMACDCEAPGNIPLEIVVADGRTVHVVDSRTSMLDDAIDTASIPTTMAALFDLVGDWHGERPDWISVSYDSRYGFPVEVEVDPDEDRYDDEIIYEISGFSPK